MAGKTAAAPAIVSEYNAVYQVAVRPWFRRPIVIPPFTTNPGDVGHAPGETTATPPWLHLNCPMTGSRKVKWYDMLAPRQILLMSSVVLPALSQLGCDGCPGGDVAFHQLSAALGTANVIVLRVSGYGETVLTNRTITVDISQADRKSIQDALSIARGPWNCDEQEPSATTLIAAEVKSADGRVSSFDLVGGSVIRVSAETPYCALLASNELERLLLGFAARPGGTVE